MREEQRDVNNQLDNWHGVKSLQKSLEKVCRGRVRDEGITWHRQLEDKLQSLRIHANFALRNCNADEETLRKLLLIPLEHYQNRHGSCLSTSRCKTDPNYGPSKVVIRYCRLSAQESSILQQPI